MTEPKLVQATARSRVPREPDEDGMTEQAFAILLASAFTFGCVAIYEMRNHAWEVTGILFRIALCLDPS